MPLEVPDSDFFGHTVFCDDIRFEVGNKVSYMGAYFGVMYLNAEFPITLPRFALSVTFAQKSELFDPAFAAWIFFPGDPDDKPSMIGEFPQIHAPGTGPYAMAQSHFVLNNLLLPMPGDIKVRILRQDRLHKLGRLKVERTPSAA